MTTKTIHTLQDTNPRPLGNLTENQQTLAVQIEPSEPLTLKKVSRGDYIEDCFAQARYYNSSFENWITRPFSTETKQAPSQQTE